MSVSVQNLTKIYGTQKAVNAISFEARKGEILGFLGPNGAGKSTTMKIATCYFSADSGSVTVCGKDTARESLEVKKLIGYLPEHNPLYLDMYVHEYLRFIGKLHEIPSKKIKSRVAEIIALCGLEKEQNKQIRMLSKGYRQRVGLGQALVHDPEVLILDEPTTGLDPNQITEIREVIREAGQEKTVIFSTHIMQEVQALCDRAVIINRGEIVADSPISELRAHGSTAKVTVEFAENIPDDFFSDLPDLQKIERRSERKITLFSNADSDLRPPVFRKAAAADRVILEMHREKDSMEDVFRELTRIDSAAK